MDFYSSILERLPKIGKYVVYRFINVTLIGIIYHDPFLFHNQNIGHKYTILHAMQQRVN